MAIKLMPNEYQGRAKEGSFTYILEPKANQILTVAGGILLVCLLVWGGMWWRKSNLTQKKSLAENKMTELQAKRDVKLEAMLIDLDESIKNLDNILKNRIYPINVLEVLEDLALPEVFFSGFQVDAQEASFNINVVALNYRILAEEMIVFKNDSRVKMVEFNSINLDNNGNASAAFHVELEPSLLRQSALLREL